MKKKVRILMIIMLLLAWLTTVDTVVSTPVNYKNCMAKADADYGKELYGAALENYQKALEYMPESVDAQIGTAKVYFATGENRKYIETCEKICECNSDNEQIVEMLMEYYLERNKVEEAVQKIVKMHQDNPDNKMVEKYYQKLRGSYEEKYCAFDYISTIIDGYASYGSEGKYGIITKDGEIVVPNIGSTSGIFYNGSNTALIVEDGKAYYVNKKGFKECIPDEDYSYLGIAAGNKILANYKGKYGYLNRDMIPQSEFQWEDATAIVDKAGAVKMNGKWAIINQKLELVTDYIYEDVIYDENRICSNGGLIWAMREGKYCLVNKDGEEITQNIYDDAKPFLTKEPTAVKKGLKWGFINSEGELVIDCKYNDAKPFRNGLAPVKLDLWGYIDREDQVVIEENFREATPFDEKKNAAVKIEDYWTIIRLYAFS